MIKVTALGFVTGDIKTTPTEKGKFVNFSLSCKSEAPKAEGKDKQFVNVELWVNGDSNLPKYITNGKQILVTNAGLYYDEVEKDGKKTRYWKIRARGEGIRLLGDGKKSSDEAPAKAEAPVESKGSEEDWE